MSKNLEGKRKYLSFFLTLASFVIIVKVSGGSVTKIAFALTTLAFPFYVSNVAGSFSKNGDAGIRKLLAFVASLFIFVYLACTVTGIDVIDLGYALTSISSIFYATNVAGKYKS